MLRGVPIFLPLLAVFLFCTDARSQETTVSFMEYGFNDAEPDVQVYALANGDTLRMNRYYFYRVSDNPEWPPAVLYCQGSGVSRAGQSLFGTGNCTHQDDDGDLLQEVWETTGGGGSGPFRVVSGTGKYAELDCKGEWRVNDTLADVPNRFVVESTLTCKRR